MGEMDDGFDGFECHFLGGGCAFYTGRLPAVLIPDLEEFESIWRLHPDQYHQIRIHGRLVPTPRFQQAYGFNYRYTGRVNEALPMPLLIAPQLEWCRMVIASRLNGLLLNWYDGKRGHHIGKHRDSTVNMDHGAPIVT